ncbi:basic proline-rich protein-like [Phyllostomus hastatus]|uniref:basic proline-rich protein-like n=1 Tax=Phyllostomus hastatus TaxID=9423 RepID=UPI001E6844B7|nr:basic proline-rich protein-like [Phyllostomus hastatus]
MDDGDQGTPQRTGVTRERRWTADSTPPPQAHKEGSSGWLRGSPRGQHGTARTARCPPAQPGEPSDTRSVLSTLAGRATRTRPAGLQARQALRGFVAAAGERSVWEPRHDASDADGGWEKPGGGKAGDPTEDFVPGSSTAHGTAGLDGAHTEDPRTCLPGPDGGRSLLRHPGLRTLRRPGSPVVLLRTLAGPGPSPGLPPPVGTQVLRDLPRPHDEDTLAHGLRGTLTPQLAPLILQHEEPAEPGCATKPVWDLERQSAPRRTAATARGEEQQQHTTRCDPETKTIRREAESPRVSPPRALPSEAEVPPAGAGPGPGPGPAGSRQAAAGSRETPGRAPAPAARAAAAPPGARADPREAAGAGESRAPAPQAGPRTRPRGSQSRPDTLLERQLPHKESLFLVPVPAPGPPEPPHQAPRTAAPSDKEASRGRASHGSRGVRPTPRARTSAGASRRSPARETLPPPPRAAHTARRGREGQEDRAEPAGRGRCSESPRPGRARCPAGGLGGGAPNRRLRPVTAQPDPGEERRGPVNDLRPASRTFRRTLPLPGTGAATTPTARRRAPRPAGSRPAPPRAARHRPAAPTARRRRDPPGRGAGRPSHSPEPRRGAARPTAASEPGGQRSGDSPPPGGRPPAPSPPLRSPPLSPRGRRHLPAPGPTHFPRPRPQALLARPRPALPGAPRPRLQAASRDLAPPRSRGAPSGGILARVRVAVAAQTDARAVLAGRGRAPRGRSRTREAATGSAQSAAGSSGHARTPPSLLGAGRRRPAARRCPRGGGGAPRFAENCHPQVGERPCARRLGSMPQHRAPRPDTGSPPLRLSGPWSPSQRLLGLRLRPLILAFTRRQF